VLFNFKRNVLKGSYLAPRQHVRQKSLRAAADGGGYAGSPTGGGSVNRFTGNSQNLILGNITQEWMPKDALGLHQLWRNMHLHDSICGMTVDLISSIPWSECSLVGIKDQSVLKPFQDSLENLRIPTLMPLLTQEMLTIGHVAAGLIFDEDAGCWIDCMPIDADFLEITPALTFNSKPKMDMKISPAQKRLLASADPRDAGVLSALPTAFLEQLRMGAKVPLDPLTTAYLARRTTIKDSIGTSILTRVIPWHVLESNLITGTILMSRRRQKDILDITIGQDGQYAWEADPNEIDAIVSSYIQADEDPLGAVVAHRSGISANYLTGGKDAWKVSDDIEMINNMKMKSLGVNEALLSGDASYNTMDKALSVFIDNVRTMRETVTQSFFYDQLFPPIARAYGFRKTTKNELDNRIRIIRPEEKQDPQKVISDLRLVGKTEGQNIPRSELMLPKIHWSKQLKPEADQSYLEILKTVKEEGVPIPLRMWTAAGGIDLQSWADMMAEDGDIRSQIQEWKQSVGSSDEQVFAHKTVKVLASAKAKFVKSLPLWGTKHSFIGLRRSEAEEFLKAMLDKQEVLHNLKDIEYVDNLIKSWFQNTYKVRAMRFIMRRLNLTEFPLEESTVQAAVGQMEKHLDKSKLARELTVIRKQQSTKPKNLTDAELSTIAKKLGADFSNMGNRLYSGLT